MLETPEPHSAEDENDVALTEVSDLGLGDRELQVRPFSLLSTSQLLSQLSSLKIELSKRSKESVEFSVGHDDPPPAFLTRRFSVTEHSDAGMRRRSLSLKNACVIFCDLVGYTALTQTKGSRLLLTEVVNPLFKSFDDMIGRHEVSKLKEIGDAYMAVSRATNRSKKELILNAMNFAKAMYQCLANLNVSLAWEHPIQMRVGMHCGPCEDIITIDITDEVHTIDIMGHTVNMAARMESGTKPGTIQMMASDYECIKDVYPVAEHFVVAVKGVAAKQNICRLPGLPMQVKDVALEECADAVVSSKSRKNRLSGRMRLSQSSDM